MGRAYCRRHGGEQNCTCSMGSINRFIEPALLLSLVLGGERHGYDLSTELNRWQVTDALVDKAAVYRTLRSLEIEGMVVSKWDIGESGPPRHIYSITPEGKALLKKWEHVLKDLGNSLLDMAGQIGWIRGLS